MLTQITPTTPRVPPLLTEHIDGKDVPESVWLQHFMVQDPRVSRSAKWHTDASLDLLVATTPLAAQFNIFGTGSLVTRFEGALIYARKDASRFFVRIAGDQDTCESVIQELKVLLPELALPKGHVNFDCWMNDDRPSSRSKVLVCPSWDDIQGNYAGATRSELTRMMRSSEPTDAGLLYLWYGPPGTGKTWAIQALAREWSEWADFHLIPDPEAFFGDARYMLHVMMFAGSDEERWNVLVLEDTGELLSADAKMRTGQGLSRLLNLTDGMLGRGSRTLVLMTSNEDIQTFHPAVSRTGRCAAKVSFEPFKRSEAASWFATKDHDAPVQVGSLVLADMYGTLRGGRVEESRRFGFGAP